MLRHSTLINQRFFDLRHITSRFVCHSRHRDDKVVNPSEEPIPCAGSVPRHRLIEVAPHLAASACRVESKIKKGRFRARERPIHLGGVMRKIRQKLANRMHLSINRGCARLIFHRVLMYKGYGLALRNDD